MAKYENNQYEIIPEEIRLLKRYLVIPRYCGVNNAKYLNLMESKWNNIFFSKSTIRGMLSNEYTSDRYFKDLLQDFISKEHLSIMVNLLNIMLKIHTKVLFLKKTLIKFKKCLNLK